MAPPRRMMAGFARQAASTPGFRDERSHQDRGRNDDQLAQRTGSSAGNTTIAFNVTNRSGARSHHLSSPATPLKTVDTAFIHDGNVSIACHSPLHRITGVIGLVTLSRAILPHHCQNVPICRHCNASSHECGGSNAQNLCCVSFSRHRCIVSPPALVKKIEGAEGTCVQAK
jgi:hypothetical protein